MPASEDHRFEWHGTGFGLLEAKLQAIAQARHTVRLEMYIYSDHPIGRQFRSALIDAALRGVQVRLMVDAIGGGDLSDDYFAELTALPNAEMKWFNEPSLATWSFRDHRKILVVDSEISFVGGCNIAEEYYGDGLEHGWRDGGLCIEGPIAKELEAEFDRQFAHADEKQWRVLKTKMLPQRRDKKEKPAPESIRPLFISPGLGESPLTESIRRDLIGAKDIAITSAYFLPTRGLRRQLGRAVAKGARLRLLLGGKSDVRLMQWATRSLYKQLLDARIDIYEYLPQVLHAKALVIDDIVYVGSSNLDPRSLRINFEIMIRIEDPELARRAREQFQQDLEHSREITHWNCWEQPWWERLLQSVSRWLLGRVDPRVSENMLRRLESRA